MLPETEYEGSYNLRTLDSGELRVSSTHRANGGRAFPRTRAAGTVRAADGNGTFQLTSDTLVTRADGTQYRIPRTSRRGGGRKRRNPEYTPSPKTVTRVLPTHTNEVASNYDTRHREDY